MKPLRQLLADSTPNGAAPLMLPTHPTARAIIEPPFSRHRNTTVHSHNLQAPASCLLDAVVASQLIRVACIHRHMRYITGWAKIHWTDWPTQFLRIITKTRLYRSKAISSSKHQCRFKTTTRHAFISEKQLLIKILKLQFVRRFRIFVLAVIDLISQF